MGKTEAPPAVKLIIGLIYKDGSALSRLEPILVRRFGPIDLRSEEFIFSYTEYYENEMGPGLKRRFITFRRLLKAERQWKVKLFTNEIEKRFAQDGRRTVNIDPGYISLGKLVLFTTKDYVHRVYLGDGIYGEATLFFKHNGFQPYNHTYPDYRTAGYIGFFNSARAAYRVQTEISKGRFPAQSQTRP